MCGDGAVLAWKVEGRVGKKETIFATGNIGFGWFLKNEVWEYASKCKTKETNKKKNKNKH